MSITTKKGDKGLTSLYLGGRVGKDNIRVEINGVLDELCSFLGLAKSLIRNRVDKRVIESIQQDLFVIGTEMVTTSKYIYKLKKRVDARYVGYLEQIIETLERKCKFEEKCFYLPGKSFIASTLDITRAIARRAERKVVTLKKMHLLENRNILIYLNRLSDLLYLLARKYENKPRKLKL